MPHLRLKRKLASWIAIVAVLMASLFPALSHALGQQGRGASWIEVCTAQGSRWVPADALEQSDTGPLVAHPLAHCPCCVSHAPDLGLPPPSCVPVVAAEPGTSHPPAFFEAARTLHAWLNAQPRAPPLFA